MTAIQTPPTTTATAPLRAWNIVRLAAQDRAGREPLSGKGDFYNLHRDLSVLYPADQGQPITPSGRLLWHLTPQGLIIQAPGDLAVNITALTQRFAVDVQGERELMPEQVLAARVGSALRVQVKVNAEARTGRREGRAASARQRSREEIAHWLKSKENELGLRITDIQISEIVTHSQHRPTRGQRERQQGGVMFTSADLDFGAVLTDPQAFARTLRSGLGRSRGFGCGMLSPRFS